jgi:hypothetical protein
MLDGDFEKAAARRRAGSRTPDAAEDAPRRGWSRERKVFTTIVALLAAIIIALAVVLGLSLSRNASSSSSSEPAAPSAEPSNTPSPSPSPSAYPMLQAPKTLTGPGGVNFECPGAGDTLYTSTYTSATAGTSTVLYLRQCGLDYNRQDLKNVTALDFGTCMDACTEWNANRASDEDACVAVTWFYSDAQGTDDNYCWLKSGTGNPRKGTWWESAIVYEP